ncbi:beta-glucosidase [Bifidobacterium lemurum]|uniref:Beta-glucosidase n=1 Tax=Bifidobacterium lemurum TaxID=1603886 RepID=A0A261FKS7_9BIFI|nr:glycoside hydrolase family 3 C-terminal domain-containing protein [Bifidobacterium lemurum]OZG59780.1 beta-glucosidase [Bifidobacterium lemurum]QOL35065.1 glycoside hydrolase family 3 C-terminal domain-containing protein [Bifidobacterium lemurum]
MFKRTNLWRGLTAIGALLLAIAIMAGSIMETYRVSLDAFVGTRSQRTVTDQSADEGDSWTYQSEFTSAEEAYNGWRDFAIEESQETMALLKNSDDALPIASDAKITMFGVRSYAPVYGGSGGSVTDGNSTVEITQAFQERGFQINPSMLQAYETYFADKEWTTPQFGGGVLPEYAEITKYDDPSELSLDELAQLNPDYNSQYGEYNDAAIVVVGRPAGENGDGYYPGEEGLAEGVNTVTGNILSLSDEEMALVDEAKANFDKVIVLVNSTNPMEIANLEDDPDIDAIMWIGFPGAYGFYGVADILNGTVSPSAHLGDVMAKNTALAPAMANYGDIAWSNASDFSEDAAVNSYLIESEGIYTGYRYYETRYADIVMGNGGEEASAGTYANADGTVSTTDGTWDYANEVVYSFGHGLSYTTFEQTLDSVEIAGDKKTATVTVTVANTGDVAGKSVAQVYASVPYTDYDKENGVEKSAIQLMDFEKTETLEPGESQTITMDVDLADLASYDAYGAETYIVDPGDYYFALGDDAHDALNNVLAAQGYTESDGMTAAGDESKTYRWTWDGDVDADTFSVSDNGTAITNQLTEGDYAMDYNAFEEGTVTYLTRSDWNGTFPTTYSGLTANEQVSELLNNDFIELKSGDDVSDITVGDTSSELTLNDMKGADFDDERWDELVGKVSVEEFMSFAENAFHAIGAIPSVGLQDMLSDDGPGGSDSHYLNEGQYQGEAFADANDEAYADKSSRVAPSPVNLAYSWNKELSYRNGELIIGESSLVFNLPIIIGPGMNLHRHAYNTRGHEYYSEDPVLSGYVGSAVVQGAQSKGTLVNVKHAAFNDQEINRSGVAVFMSEQKAREMELRNLQQAFEAKGKPASFEADESKADTYTQGALGVMTSYNRIGAVASSANAAVMVNIMRGEWGFTGYNVTDFTSVSPHAAPKESILAGTTAFCGFGNMGVSYWDAETLSGDRDVLLAIQQDVKYALWALANSNAMNGVNSTTHTENVMTWWRAAYIAAIAVTGVVTAAGVIGYTVVRVRGAKSVAAPAGVSSK